MMVFRKAGGSTLGLAALACAIPATAEVTSTTGESFVSRHEVVVEADTKEVWLALISPATWWRSDHTWSGDAKNLTLTPQAGGCFCETIPEVDEPGRFTLEGSVEHMRVVQAYPESALRMVGALGPLQSEPVNGVLTIAITKVEKGTRILWEYVVGGSMRYELPVISKAVDGVMGAQLAALAKPLKVVDASSAETEESAPASKAEDEKDAPAGAAGEGGTKPAAAKPSERPDEKPAAKTEPKPAPKTPSVQDAFGDLDPKAPG